MEENVVTKGDRYSPLALAFLGDAVFEMYIREHLLSKANAPVDSLHKKAVRYVKASAQCEAFDRIEPYLNEKELRVFKRGRNAKINTKAKNAALSEYKKATGFETLLGYLHINGDISRLNELLSIAAVFN
ncbi:MAG: Mini-ribonuclease 3 [Clostridia bacterium]|nr:Mini-ribonuclease 3 [Clostridia bacterium]MBO5453681.1 Mini-ribonuclease 3 [Clostridia bacterium]